MWIIDINVEGTIKYQYELDELKFHKTPRGIQGQDKSMKKEDLPEDIS